MADALLVPIHVAALHLESGTALAGASIDFSRTPYFDGKTDINSDRPYLSKELRAQAFEDRTFFANAGIHLHWALPDALTVGRVQKGVANYLYAPNRWLVTCYRGNQKEGVWLIQSDYLYPEALSAHPLGIASYPVTFGTVPFAIWGGPGNWRTGKSSRLMRKAGSNTCNNGTR